MRRYFLPVVVLAVVIAASVLAGRADDAADPDTGSGATTADPLATPLLSARRAPEWLRQPTTDEILERGVTAALAGLPDTAAACLAVHRDGVSIAAVDSTVPMIPGHLQRLTTIAALPAGAAGFTTEVVRNADDVIEDGVLLGDLYLIGGADPVLSTPAFIERFGDGRASTSLLELAGATVDALTEQGITSIQGSVIGVDLKYATNTPSNADVWTATDIASNAVGVTDGLLLDNGFAEFDPEAPVAEARVRTSNPEAHAAENFGGWVQFLGIPVGGASSGDGPEVSARETVASIESPAMVEIARRALVDGTTAEMLYRELAVRNGFVGDLPVGGFLAVNAALTGSDIVSADEVGNVPAFDGSGLSLRNLSRCDIAIAILDGQAGDLAPAALTGLGAATVGSCAPTSGMSELDVLASARPEVTSLAGRSVASNGDVLTFSLIVNWAPDEAGVFAPRDICSDAVPALLDAIAAHPGGPDLAELTPLPVDPGA